MSRKVQLEQLSRRERQIMDVIYRLGRATVVDVMEHIPDDLGNSTVRKQLNILEEKGYLRHKQQKNFNIFYPTIKAENARTSAMKHLLDTFFHGSVSQAFITLMDVSGDQLTEKDRELISQLIERSREDGR